MIRELFLSLQRDTKHAGNDPDIHLFIDGGNGDQEVAALQTGADVVVQKSTGEGFGVSASRLYGRALR